MASDIPMTGRQRYLCALNHVEGDRVPISEVALSRRFIKHMLGFEPTVPDPETMARVAVAAGYDTIFASQGGLPGFRIDDSGDIYTDEWGTTYKKDESSWPMDGPLAYPLKTPEDWKNYDMPDPSLERRYKGVEAAIRIGRENGLGVMGSVRGPFSSSWFLFGLDVFSVMYYEAPETVHEIMTAMTDYAEYGLLKMLELGCDAVQYQDDFGSNQAPFMSPAFFDEFIKPYNDRLCQAVHKAGGKLLLHSDGQIMLLLPSLKKSGIDGLNPIQRGAGMDIAEVKRLYGDQFLLYGNVDQRYLLTRGTPAEVEAQVKEIIRIAAPGGGFVLQSDHSLHDDIPPENALAIVEAGRKYGKYPIRMED